MHQLTTATPPTLTATDVPAGPNAKPKFKAGDRFLQELKTRVDAYFERTGFRRRDCPTMYLKTGVMLAWFFGAYALLLFVAASPWTVVPLAILLGLALAGIGFNVQHDGGHKAYSDRQWVNRLMALSMDMIGGSSYLWDVKHNSIHHTYTNIDGHDDDIDVGLLGRLSPHQRWMPFHRFQGFYLWPLYGLLAMKWHLMDDFVTVAKGKIGHHKIARPKGVDLAVFIGGKAIFYSLAFAIPMLVLHKVWPVLGVYALAACVSGVTMSVVFQLAHCVEEAAFPAPVADANGKQHMETAWAVHQVQTTVDFARRNRVLCWFLGGLNFQVEHHLFHKICHVHYPALSKVVEDACHEFGVKYNANKTFLAAIASHGRFLFEMGRPTAV